MAVWIRPVGVQLVQRVTLWRRGNGDFPLHLRLWRTLYDVVIIRSDKWIFLGRSVPLWQALKTLGSLIITGFRFNIANCSWWSFAVLVVIPNEGGRLPFYSLFWLSCPVAMPTSYLSSWPVVYNCYVKIKIITEDLLIVFSGVISGIC